MCQVKSLEADEGEIGREELAWLARCNGFFTDRNKTSLLQFAVSFGISVLSLDVPGSMGNGIKENSSNGNTQYSSVHFSALSFFFFCFSDTKWTELCDYLPCHHLDDSFTVQNGGDFVDK